MKSKLKILYLVAEVYPYSKAGGLADVASGLSKTLHNLGAEIIIVTPNCGVLNPHDLESAFHHVPVEIDEANKFRIGFQRDYIDDIIPVYFVCHWNFFERYKNAYRKNIAQRFYLFSSAALALPKLINWQPDIIHVNDWHTAMTLQLIDENPEFAYLKNAGRVLTIHNLLYQGDKPKGDDGEKPLPQFNSPKLSRINFMKRGIKHADVINAVSENYRDEILTKDFGEGLQVLLHHRQRTVFGITNGIDEQIFSPLTDPNVPVPYGISTIEKKYANKKLLQKEFGLPQLENIPLIGMMSRWTRQKGFDLIIAIADDLAKLDLQLIVAGGGSRKIAAKLAKIAKKYPEKIAVKPEFLREKSSLVYAGCDMFLMPSRFEPCGLGQLLALRYGTIPIVRKVGGLANTVFDYNPRRREGNGFVFQRYEPIALYTALVRAIETYHHQGDWREIVKGVMRQSYSWDIPAKRYLKLYRFALRQRDKRLQSRA